MDRSPSTLAAAVALAANTRIATRRRRLVGPEFTTHLAIARTCPSPTLGRPPPLPRKRTRRLRLGDRLAFPGTTKRPSRWSLSGAHWLTGRRRGFSFQP